MGDVLLNPNNKEINVEDQKQFNIVYPDRKVHPSIAMYVQETVDGKYILNYLELHKGQKVPSFTELLFVDGEWAKNPFHKDYEAYTFKPFDEELSNSIVEQLPNYMYFKVQIKPDAKDESIVYDNKKEEILTPIKNNSLSNVKDSTNYLFMVLLANDGECRIDKLPNGGKYDFNFPFPVFSLPYPQKHEAYSTCATDVNGELTFDEHEYPCEELPIDVRREVADYLQNHTDTHFDVRNLPVFCYNAKDGRKYEICFVSCSSLELFNEVYRAEYLDVDIQMELSNRFDNDLDSGLNHEVPLLVFGKNGSIYSNGVLHKTPIGYGML